MKSRRNILSSVSRYIHGDRYSFVALAVILFILCCATILALLILVRILTNGLHSVPFPGSPTQSSTPYSYRDCTDGLPYSGIWSSQLEGMRFEAFLCPDGTLIAIFHDQEIPESMTIGKAPPNLLEFSWGVSVDVDSDNTTGTTAGHFEGIVGADYRILLAHWSHGSERTVPFDNAHQVNVWHCIDDRSQLISDAEVFIDTQDGLLVLRGFIPGMSSNSRVLFSRFYHSSYSESTYKTDWVISGR